MDINVCFKHNNDDYVHLLMAHIHYSNCFTHNHISCS